MRQRSLLLHREVGMQVIWDFERGKVENRLIWWNVSHNGKKTAICVCRGQVDIGRYLYVYQMYLHTRMWPKRDLKISDFWSFFLTVYMFTIHISYVPHEWKSELGQLYLAGNVCVCVTWVGHFGTSTLPSDSEVHHRGSIKPIQNQLEDQLKSIEAICLIEAVADSESASFSFFRCTACSFSEDKGIVMLTWFRL